MTKDKVLKLALDFVTSIHPAFICEATHHKKKEQHASNEPCPHVEKQKQTYEAIKEALAQRPWVGLSDEEIVEIAVKSQDGISPHDDTLRFARAIEAILKEKNT